MLRRVLLVLGLMSLAFPVCAEQVDIHHPQVKGGAKGLFIDGKAYVPIDVVNQIMPGTFAWDAQHRTIVKPVSGIKPVLFIGEADSVLLSRLRSSGISVETSTRLPEQLGTYSTLILANENAYMPGIVPRLTKLLQHGGGLVLMQGWPDRLNRPGQGMEDIAAWFGAGALNNQANKWHVFPSMDNPFGLAMDKGEEIWSSTGADLVTMPRREELGSASQEVVSTNDYMGQRVFAFAHPYPPGRVYWQSVVPPDSTKLMGIFVGGVKWAAGIIRDVSP